MKSYILLRDRIETKAMSLEELHAMGLRPTDRIWVECQSWDWERPEQVAELKILLDGQAPQVNSTAAQNPVIPKEPVKTAASIIVGQQAVPGKKPAVLHIKKTILPDPVPTIAAQQPIPEEQPALIVEPEKVLPVPETEADMYKYGGISSAVAAMKDDPNFNADINASVTVKDNPPTTVNEYAGIKSKQDSPAPEINYTRSLDEIKELYVKNLAEQGRLQKTKKRGWSLKELKKVAVYIGFAAAGALTMVLVTNSGNKKTTTTLPVTQEPVASLTQPVSNTQDPVDLQATGPANTVAVENIPPEETVPDRSEEKRSTDPVKPASPEKRSVVPDETEKEPVMETTTVVEEPGSKKIDNRSTISSQVSLKANDYTTGSFGGIRNLEMTVQNNSKYLLDEVTVELKYLNLDGIPVHTDHIVFRSVQPGQPETMAVKKSRRGMKVKYRVTKIESKEADGSVAGF